MTQQKEQARLSEADASEVIVGEITSLKGGIVRGWIENADPKRVLALYIRRRRVATTRQSTSAGKLRSEFAFDAKGCPPDLLEGTELAIDVAILGEPSAKVASIKISTETLLKLEDVPEAPEHGRLEGCIDEKTPHLVRGWVFDASRPERQVDIFLFRGNRYLGKYTATASRPDLAATGRGHGNYGFAIPVKDGAGVYTVIAGEPEFWRIPLGAHAVASSHGPSPGGLRLRDLPNSIETFARVLTGTEPFPKKTFVIDKLKHGSVPDAFSADYVALALECLRHEMVAKGEAMSGGWRSRLRSWGEMRVLGARIRRLEELAAAISEGPRLLEAAAKRRKAEAG